jgi:hypothetical protein
MPTRTARQTWAMGTARQRPITLLLAETIQRVVGLCLAVPIAHVCLAVRVGIF